MHSGQQAITMTCDVCGRQYLKNVCHIVSFEHSYCSNLCYQKYRKEHHVQKGLGGNGGLVIKTCLNCGKEYVCPRWRNHLSNYCCVGCSNSARAKVANKLDHVCAYCGKHFYSFRAKHKVRVYCSNKCGSLGRWKNKRSSEATHVIAKKKDIV